MAIEVEFVTLGDVSKRLEVPAPTLRLWTDQMEEFDAHYVNRNHRNERVYDSSDLRVFTVFRDMKAKYGRKTTTLDLAKMFIDKEEELEIKLRRGEDAPEIPPSNKSADLLNQEDIKRLMASERVKQFVAIVVAENAKAMREDLIEEIRESVRAELLESEKKTQEQLSRIDDRIRERTEQTDKWLTEMREEREEKKRIDEEIRREKQGMGWWSRLIGK